MKTNPPSRIPLYTLGIICAALIIWVVQLRSDIVSLTADVADAQARLKAAVSAQKQRAQVARSEARSSDSTSATIPDMEAAATDSARKRNVNAGEMEAMMKNPVMRDLIASQQATVTQATYSDLMDRLQLAPHERDFFGKLLLDKQMSTVNLGIQLTNPDLSPDQRTALIQQLRDAQANSEAQINNFLNSDADYATYQAYSQQKPEHMEVGMFESSIAGSEPLDPAKADALAALLHDTRANFPFTVDFYDQRNMGRPQNLNAATINKFFGEQSQFQSQIAEKAADILTPTQMEAFKQNQSGMRQMMKMQLNSITQSGGQ